ncbi:hypothetical protein EJ377_03475 [Chryseobacterium arthrosphaerae]|uniref:Uncharacterized protein n=1 Tax=Chryseobacterium arthrosphaerae TaxID=651561 RepID=A0A432DZ53_9FLAO|nr:hypothetical protein EJ377_03475 [Chryseobacterium arthrosphaerae]
MAFFNSCSGDNYDMINPSGQKLLLSKVTTTYYDDPTKPETAVETLEYNSQESLSGCSLKEEAALLNTATENL